MNPQLFQAAWNGDVDRLVQELDANPTMLHTLALHGGENPLHIACLAGHLNFVSTIVKLRPQFCWELNEDGFSPLHIAAACGHEEIVKELLKVDHGLCLIEGKDRKVALHLAVIKGKVEVVKELLFWCLDSVECMTAQGETSLHLAVKNSQFKAFQVLIQHLNQVNKEDVVNYKDFHGNTILHLAVYRKQYEVVQILLNDLLISKEKINVNPLNNTGLTPLDMLLMFQSEAGDREIEEHLIKSGALKAENLPSPPSAQQRPAHLDTTHEPRHRSPAKKLLDYFKYNNLSDSPSMVRNTLLVIVILITAATYQPALSPPGGIWQDDLVANTSSSSATGNSNSNSNSNTTATKPHTAGRAIMITHNPVAFGIFLFANSVGFYMSLHMILVLTAAFPLRMELHILVVSLSTTYVTCMNAICIESVVNYGFIGTSVVLPFSIPVATMCLRNYLNRHKNCESADTNDERIQTRTVGSSVHLNP